MIIACGAEAVLKKEGSVLVKNRVKKGYRIEALDSRLRKERTKHEESLLREARRAGVSVPAVIGSADYALKMQFIDGPKVKDVLSAANAGILEMPQHFRNARKQSFLSILAEETGISIARLHSFNIIHGDLTTSNMLLKDGHVFFIDFGLGFHSSKTEDKAVDLHLLRQAVVSAHHEIASDFWNMALKAYEKHYEKGKEVIERIKKTEKRGRYKKR